MDAISEKRRHRLITSLYGLTVSSLVPKVIFVIVISILYVSNYLFTKEQSRIVVPLVGLISGFLPFFIIMYAIGKSVYHFKVYKLRLAFDSLPASFKGLRIVQISDAHLGSFNFKYHIVERAFKKINNLKPDIIVFTGDLVNNYAWELEGWSQVFKKLVAPLGKFAVLGNHDYGDYSEWTQKTEKQENFESIIHFFKKIDFYLLRNEAIKINRGQEEIALLGVENWGKPPFKQYGDLKKALDGVPVHLFKILLSHDPSHWDEEVVVDTNIALTLSGHTHGAQAGIQYKARAWSPIKYKYKHWAGFYQKDNQLLYVNRGLGWLGFPGRVGMRPEITFFELV